MHFIHSYIIIFFMHRVYRLSNLNHSKADIITNAKTTAWDPEIGFNKNSEPFNLPWKVTGDTVDDSVIIRFNLQNDNTRKHCPKTDKGMTVGTYIFTI